MHDLAIAKAMIVFMPVKRVPVVAGCQRPDAPVVRSQIEVRHRRGLHDIALPTACPDSTHSG